MSENQKRVEPIGDYLFPKAGLRVTVYEGGRMLVEYDYIDLKDVPVSAPARKPPSPR